MSEQASQERRLLHMHDDINRLNDLAALTEAAWDAVSQGCATEKRVRQGYAFLLGSISDVAKDLLDRIREVRGIPLEEDP